MVRRETSTRPAAMRVSMARALIFYDWFEFGRKWIVTVVRWPWSAVIPTLRMVPPFETRIPSKSLTKAWSSGVSGISSKTKFSDIKYFIISCIEHKQSAGIITRWRTWRKWRLCLSWRKRRTWRRSYSMLSGTPFAFTKLCEKSAHAIHAPSRLGARLTGDLMFHRADIRRATRWNHRCAARHLGARR